jgi:hypothetical protein
MYLASMHHLLQLSDWVVLASKSSQERGLSFADFAAKNW